MAFQIVDDVLDLTASEDVLGKPVASDLREGKVTMAVIHALERCTAEERTKIETVLQHGAFNGVTHARDSGDSAALRLAGSCHSVGRALRGIRLEVDLHLPRLGDQACPAVGAGVCGRARESRVPGRQTPASPPVSLSTDSPLQIKLTAVTISRDRCYRLFFSSV